MFNTKRPTWRYIPGPIISSVSQKNYHISIGDPNRQIKGQTNWRYNPGPIIPTVSQKNYHISIGRPRSKL